MKITQICALLVAAGVVMGLYGIVVILVCMRGMGGNAKFTGFIGRIRDWEFRHPWIARPFWYFALLVFVLGACYCTFNYFDLYHTDADSARYMLSAMVQAQAAIIAIVITLTLIAVQLTASAYSPRVIPVFKNNPDMWLLLGFYGLSMLYGLVVLKMVVGGTGGVVSRDVFWFRGFVPISFECCVSLAYWLEVFTFVALFPYLLNIIDLLKSENIIKKLSERINRENVLNFIRPEEKHNGNRTKPTKDDPVQPIVAIIHDSVMKYDIATTGYGLKAITDKAIEVVHSDHEIETSRHFCTHLERIGKLAVSREDGESVRKVIGHLEFFGELTAEKGLGDAAWIAAQKLKSVGIVAAKKELEDAAWAAAESLGSVGTIAATEKGLDVVAWYIVQYIESVGRVAAGQEFDFATSQAAESLGLVGAVAAEKGLKLAAEQAARSLGCVGRVAAEKELKLAAEQAAESLGLVGAVATENGLETATSRVARSLVDVGMSATRYGLEDARLQAAQSMAELTIPSERTVKAAIQELKHQHQGHMPFKKFMNLYDHKLEELRTRKPD